jgi:hypothetical protein
VESHRHEWADSLGPVEEEATDRLRAALEETRAAMDDLSKARGAAEGLRSYRLGDALAGQLGGVYVPAKLTIDIRKNLIRQFDSFSPATGLVDALESVLTPPAPPRPRRQATVAESSMRGPAIPRPVDPSGPIRGVTAGPAT